jgi:hypothetical protein
MASSRQDRLRFHDAILRAARRIVGNRIHNRDGASRWSSAYVRRRRAALDPDDAVNVEVVDLVSWAEEATRVDHIVDVGLLGTQIIGAHVGPEFLQGLESSLRGTFKVVQRIPHPESFASRTDTVQGATMPYRHGFDNLRTRSKPPA